MGVSHKSHMSSGHCHSRRDRSYHGPRCFGIVSGAITADFHQRFIVVCRWAIKNETRKMHRLVAARISSKVSWWPMLNRRRTKCRSPADLRKTPTAPRALKRRLVGCPSQRSYQACQSRRHRSASRKTFAFLFSRARRHDRANTT